MWLSFYFFFFFSSRRRHTRCSRDWSSDVCSSDLRELRCIVPGDRFPQPGQAERRRVGGQPVAQGLHARRSEEHTSELQSRLHLVCRLLLEKKKSIKHRVSSIGRFETVVVMRRIRL